MKSKKDKLNTILKSAEISACGRYRYRLERTWDPERPAVLFIMLNPSAADDLRDDPTIRRCIRFAAELGFGKLMCGNLFAFRSHRPVDLLSTQAAAGPENQRHLLEMAEAADTIICAWGNEVILKKMGFSAGRECLPDGLSQRELHVLRLSKKGIPCHPLYLPSHLKPEKWL